MIPPKIHEHPLLINVVSMSSTSGRLTPNPAPSHPKNIPPQPKRSTRKPNHVEQPDPPKEKRKQAHPHAPRESQHRTHVEQPDPPHQRKKKDTRAPPRNAKKPKPCRDPRPKARPSRVGSAAQVANRPHMALPKFCCCGMQPPGPERQKASGARAREILKPSPSELQKKPLGEKNVT